MTATPGQPTRIVILGGGFAGVYTARKLERLLGRRTDVEISLVNRDNYFVFQPLIPEIVSGNVGILDTVSPIRSLIKRTRLFVRDVDRVDLEKRRVILCAGFKPRPYVLDYDHLVLALGNVTDFRGMPGLHEHALPFKNVADAIELRNHLIRVLEEASVETDPEFRKQLLTFVVAGGGFSGVEVAAEMNDFLRREGERQYPIDPKEIRVVLVHSGLRVLEREMGEKLSKYAMRVLERHGVEMCMNRRLKAATPEAAVLDNDERILTKTLVSTVPSFPNPLIDGLDLPKQKGRVEVDEHLRVKDRPGLWALGDCALVPIAGTDTFCPPTAQHATRQAEVLAANIVATMHTRPLKSFRFQGLGKLGALGHHRAVAELFGKVRIGGFPAWLLWRTIYWWKLPGFMRKVKVGLSWALDLAFPPDFSQLKLSPSQGVGQAHFEAGEYVFHQGDLGDALYIIVKGTADVVKECDGQEDVLAQLHAGEMFGELALLNQPTRMASIRCTTALDVIVIRRSEFGVLATNLTSFRENIDRLAAERAQRDPSPMAAEPSEDRS
ncbi:MAG: FAD-dependent oxidoreductase [Planctomycetota bacterium]